MPINVSKFIFLFHVTKVLFVSYTLLYIYFLNGVLCITLPRRRGSRPDGARSLINKIVSLNFGPRYLLDLDTC